MFIPKKQKVFSAFILSLIISFVLAFNGIAFAAVNGDTIALTVLTVNDFHGAIADKGTGKDPGAAKLAAFLKQEKAKDPTGTLLLSAGDMFQGSADSNLVYGKSIVEVMNSVGFDAMSLGNHEFDWGIDTLMKMKAQANFPWGAANIKSSNGQLPAFARPSVLTPVPYIFVTRENLKIGIIPLATPETAFKANPKIVGQYRFEEPSATVKDLAQKLRSKGAQVIIVLSHLGADQNSTTQQITGEAADLANKLPVGTVDAIVTGHTHTAVAGTVNNIPMVQALNNGQRVGKILLNYSKAQGKVISSTPTLMNLTTMTLTGDRTAQAIVDKYAAQIAPIKNTVLGSTKYDLTHDRYGSNVSLLGEWATDVMRAAVGADFAFQNGGGLRTTIYAGNVTVGNMYEVMPFDNTLNTMDMTGAQIIQVLDYGIKNTTIGMLQFSGANVVYDGSRPAGSRIVSVTMPDGSQINTAKKYKVVTNDFMATGGDGYTTFKQASNIVETGVPVRDTLSDAVKKAGQIAFTGDNRLTIK
ncbi:MAG TPA: 5'-nucleotidase C-terminal domain-containing protein [Methylomusa anaerophila]|uniref:Endonuclease YhcR n=1 Tax=Methylomusa anaerophila TaxID=1930071 RepID=A0A348AH20_9FIRM|nr:5'-nucleotidase C-terminal domain-containing protein [Methylomusa anaerophila]BBB90368.1 endonuclease YhcR precursor [Methylomusa anaerophila]HML89285.1 5'-nucleotidase C-terminal domain-containing protein [Methylomusa anaerophila]